MEDNKRAAVQAEMQRVQIEMDHMVAVQLAGMCAELRLENAALRKALAEKGQAADPTTAPGPA